MSEEFALDRNIEFEAALSNARDVMDAESELYKQQSANLAIDKLFKAQKHRLEYFNKTIESSNNVDNLMTAQKLLQQAMMTTVMRIKCILETGQVEMARSRLKESLELYPSYVETLVKNLLGDYPSMYFHGEIADEDFQRYLQIESWLRNESDVLSTLVNEYRGNFWDEKAIKRLKLNNSRIASFFNRGSDTESDTEPDHLKALTLAEVAIEDYNRLVGFELEIASMRLTSQQIDVIKQHDDYLYLVDTDLIDATNRLSIQ